jgi:hypothetical protein
MSKDSKAAEEVGPGNEYPIRKFSMAGQGIVRMGKYGLRMEVQEEATKFVKSFDIYGMMLRACGKAMARAKEKRIFSHINKSGVVVFDNLDGSVLNTSGIGPTGAQNGSITLDDIITMAGELITAGFNPDTIIINGLAWTVFSRTPELRNLVIAQGAGPLVQWPKGQAGVHPSSTSNPMLYPWTQAAPLSTMYTTPNPQFVGRSFNTVVTPYQSYTPAGANTPSLCTVTVADSRYLGVLLQGEPISSDEWKDPRIDVQSVKFREYYAIATSAEGQGIRVAKNVALVRGLDPMLSVGFTEELSSLTWPGPKTAISSLSE